MHEILRRLPPGASVLDLGCGPGSFPSSATPARVFRLDAALPPSPPSNFVLSDAARLPFPSRSLDAVISNHSLEHIARIEAAVSEIARVLRPGGFLYVAVPDASTLADRIYRWLGRGGGHVNPFLHESDIVTLFRRASGPPVAAIRLLHCSLSFLNRRNCVARPPRRLMLFANGAEWFLRLFTLTLRRLDRLFHTRFSVYGWAYYFGPLDPSEVPDSPSPNVCIRCGSAHPAAWLLRQGSVERRRWLPDRFTCPSCGAPNYFTPES